MIQPLEWQGDRLKMLDQTKLPKAEVWYELTDYRDVAQAIKTMQVRGAPAIGVAAAYGVALGALGTHTEDTASFRAELEKVFETLAATRPTARNLFSAIERMRQVVLSIYDTAESTQKLLAEAIEIHRGQIKADRALAVLGAGLIEPDSTILTHCNTGPLATAGYGTALGIIICAHQQGKVEGVLATETRPLCQGARLTAWELKQAGIPFKLITDSMAGYVMSRGMVDAVIVGADRIARNGDTANKIGTYTLAVLAKENGVPFYVAAPTTTVDKDIATEAEIVIEERAPEEVTCIGGVRVAAEGAEVLNPAFDVTPARYITAIITEKEIWRPGQI
jgi:methylthioribose-1-phosphate isomerase